MLKQNVGWAWSMWAKRPGLVMGPCIVEIDRCVIREVQNQLKVNRCRNKEVTLHCRTYAYSFHVFNFQGSSANSVGGDSGQDGRTDHGDNYIIPSLQFGSWG
ncbi:hypothetical protein DPMN_190267 [Dreissena polymorpha]|uniref:Uncharacterized protein n=1 Tax=Dreissena polymorpha TaxID=45954 RepID=A0A9D4DWY5_DREPO|nr:hypothetical protein DPMN_190267 [Dreissena polymorpha]